MSYTPINWQTGDVITAEKLNKMDNGWAITSAQLFSETVTTISDGSEGAYGTLTYTALIDAPTITVTFNGSDYVCKRRNKAIGDVGYYGAKTSKDGTDFSEYPFYISTSDGDNSIATETAGTYTVAVSVSTVETSTNFANAVKNVAGTAPLLCVSGTTTYDEMSAAISDGRLLFFQKSKLGGTSTYIITALGTMSPDGASVTCIPELSGVSVDSSGTFVVGGGIDIG